MNVAKHLSGCPMFLAVFVFLVCWGGHSSLAQILIDDFNDGNDDGWQHTDTSTDRPWGPATFDASSFSYHLEGAGDVPMGKGSSTLLSMYELSADPVFNNGFLQTTLRTDNDSLVYLVMRGDVSTFTGYIFGATANTGNFFWNKVVNGSVVEEGATISPNPPFNVEQDWVLEAGTVGGQLSMKAWRLGEPEPVAPQWTHIDSTISEGQFGVGANHWTVLPAATVNATFDDIMFTFPLAPEFDFNMDNLADVADLDLLVGEISAPEPSQRFDVSGDGLINSIDLSEWLNGAADINGFAQPYLPGDSNLDGTVDSQDLNNLARNWNQEIALWSGGDFEPNGSVDAADLNALAINWRQSIPVAAATRNVPEPSATVTVILTLAAMTCLRRRR